MGTFLALIPAGGLVGARRGLGWYVGFGCKDSLVTGEVSERGLQFLEFSSYDFCAERCSGQAGSASGSNI